MVRLADPASLDAAELERFVAARSRSRLAVEPPFAGTPAHAHLWAEVASAAGSGDACAIAAVDDDVRALCVARAPAWDREHFGFTLGRVEYLIAADAEAAAAALGWALQRLGALGARVCSARVPVDDLVVIGALEAASFRFVEHVLTPWRTMPDWRRQGMGVTRPTRPEDLDALCRIARATFRTDRFHLDPGFDRAAADGVYVRWIQSWHEDPPSGARSLVALDDEGRVAGFFLYRVVQPAGIPGRRVTDLVLGGMAPRAAGRGLGYRMYCDVLDDAAPDCEYARVTIVTANSAVLNLYVKLGFRFSTGGEVTLHRWEDRCASS